MEGKLLENGGRTNEEWRGELLEDGGGNFKNGGENFWRMEGRTFEERGELKKNGGGTIRRWRRELLEDGGDNF